MGSIGQKIQKEVVGLVSQTGQLLLKIFQQNKTNSRRFKSKHEIVTAADLLAEKFLLQKIKKLTPNFQIISEEKGDNHKKSEFLWLIDPLDGTTNFYMGNPLFAVQIALVYLNQPIFSCLYAPAIKELYWASRNRGAFLNNRKIHVSNKTIKHALLTYCHGNSLANLKKALKIYRHFKLHNFDIRQLGCAALEFGWVAKGKTECYISPGARLWDVVPGDLLLQEAGGQVYDFKGKPWTLQSKTIFAGNGVVDLPILKFLKKL
jgi:myo-inositol-1(or 4)-monophosphatase